MAVVKEAASRDSEYHETYFAAARAIAGASPDPTADLDNLASSASSYVSVVRCFTTV